MNKNQMVIELSRKIGGQFLGLTTVTEVKMNKTNGERAKATKRINPFFRQSCCCSELNLSTKL